MARAADSSEQSPVRPLQAVLLCVVVEVLALSGLPPLMAYPVAALALSSLVYGRRMALAVLACIGAGVLVAWAIDPAQYAVVFPLGGLPLTARAPLAVGALVALSLLLVGPVTATLMRKRPALETAVVVALGLSAAEVLTLAVLADGASMSLQAYVSSAIALVVAPMSGLADAEATFVKVWPSVVVWMNGVTALLAVAGVRAVAVRRRVAASRFPALASIDLDPRMVIPGIVAVALLAAGRLPMDAAPVLTTVGQNLLAVVRWVFFLQGVAVFATLYDRAKYGRMTRALGYVLLGVTEVLLPLVSLTGLADIWLNIRRLPRENRSDEAVEAPSDTD